MFDYMRLVISAQTNADDIDDWDSLNHIRLASPLKMAFKFRFILSEIELLKSVGGLIEFIEKKQLHS